MNGVYTSAKARSIYTLVVTAGEVTRMDRPQRDPPTMVRESMAIQNHHGGLKREGKPTFNGSKSIEVDRNGGFVRAQISQKRTSSFHRFGLAGQVVVQDPRFESTQTLENQTFNAPLGERAMGAMESDLATPRTGDLQWSMLNIMWIRRGII